METTGAHHPPSPERYVSRVELAQLMGISVSTIDRLVGSGMPSVIWAKRCRRAFSPAKRSRGRNSSNALPRSGDVCGRAGKSRCDAPQWRGVPTLE